MIERDIPAVLEIDRLTGEPAMFEGDFVRFIRKRRAYRPLVLVDGLCLQAWCVLRLEERLLIVERAAAHPDFSDELAWSFFLADLQPAVNEGAIDRIVLRIWEYSVPLQKFFQHRGFYATASLRGQAEDCSDLIQMEYGADLAREHAR